MTARSMLLSFLLVLPAGAEEKKPDPKGDASALQGVWEVVSTTFNGDQIPTLGRTLVFTATEFTAYVRDQKGRTISFKLNPRANPKQIDLDRGGDRGSASGIYSLEKDELKICYGEPGAERPGKFESRSGDNVFLMVLKRVKK